MAKNIDFEVKGSIDCSKLTDDERAAQLKRLHEAHNTDHALEELIKRDIDGHAPHLKAKWVGMTSTLTAR